MRARATFHRHRASRPAPGAAVWACLIIVVAVAGPGGFGCALGEPDRESAARAEPRVADVNEPSHTLRGEDRLDWEGSEFTLPLGQISHPPTYIATPGVPDNAPLVLGGPIESRMAAAMAPGDGKAWSARETVDLVAQPLWFYPQAALLPVKVLVHPPTSRELTPPGHANRADLEVVPAVPR